MRVFFILFKKEFKQFFLTPFGWVILALILLMQGMSTGHAMEMMKDKPLAENFIFVSLHSPNFWFYFIFMFPLLTMRLFAEEEKGGTLETLMTAPVTSLQVVLSKYCAAITFYALLWLPILLHLQIFVWVTDSPAPYEIGHLLGTYATLMLIGSFFIAIGCFASSMTSSQIIAGIITITLLVLHFLLGLIPYYFGDGFRAISAFHYVAIQEHLANGARGLLDTKPIIYYLSMAAFFLFLTHITLDFRRWKS